MDKGKQLVVEIIRHDGVDGVYHIVLEPHTNDERVYSLSREGLKSFAWQLQSMVESPSTCHLMSAYDLRQSELPPMEEVEEESK